MHTIYKRVAIVSGFGLLLLLLATNAWIIRLQLGVLIDNQTGVAHTQESLSELAQTEALLSDAETSQRGFLYTGDPKYLEPFTRAAPLVGAHIDILARLTENSPHQQACVSELRGLAAAKLHELARTIALYQSGRPDEAKALVMTDHGLFLMMDMQKIIGQMEAEETAMEAVRSTAYRRTVRVTVACIYLASFAGAFGAVLLAYFTLREMSARQALQHSEERLVLRRSEDKDREQQLQIQIKEQFLSHVSHELRSPLTSIYSFSTLIVDGLAGEVSPQQQEYLQIIMRNVDQLLSMIEDLLEDTQVREAKLKVQLQAASVPEAIEYAVDTLRGASEGKGVVLSSHFSPDLPSAYADPMRLRQILTVLLDNAVKFTPPGGAVAARGSLSQAFPGFLLMEVSDTGRGIDPEKTERIFERLYQATDPGEAGRRGLGLGLHIARGLVIRQGGTIWVSSELGKGSRFSFTLPILSLSSLIRPILMHEEKPGEAIALLAVELRPREGSADAPEDIQDAARVLITQCLRPDTDVLLPHLSPSGGQAPLFAVAYTQREGAEVIGTRVQSYLQGNEQIQSAELTVAVSYSFLAPLPKEVDESLDSFVDRIAAGVQDRIDIICRTGAPQYVAKENSGCR